MVTNVLSEEAVPKNRPFNSVMVKVQRSSSSHEEKKKKDVQGMMDSVLPRLKYVRRGKKVSSGRERE